MKERERNYDLLRTVSCIMIVALHWGCFFCGKNYQSDTYAYIIGYFLQSISRFAVPCFIMLSGAFILGSKKTEQIIPFWAKSVRKLVIPAMCFSVFYVLFSYARIFIGSKSEQVDFILPLLNWLKGEPYWHMWYIYMLMGIYFVAPFIAIMKKCISRYTYFTLIVLLLVLGIILEYTCNLIWCFQFIQYGGYFMLGDYIKKYKKTNSKIYKYKNWILGFAMCILVVVYLLSYTLKDDYTYFQPMSPLIICSSVGIFLWFSHTEVNLKTSWISEKSLYIYLLHVGIMECINIFVTKVLGYPPAIVYFPIGFIVTIILSLIGSQIMCLLQDKIKNKCLRK